MVRIGLLAGALLAVTMGTPGAARAEVTVELVAELHRNEPYEGHLFHDGHLWVTRSRQQDGEKHHVDVYDAAGRTRLATVDLEHTAAFLYPYGPDAVIAVGKSAEPHWKSHFTVITRSGDRFTTRRTTLPEQYLVEQATGDRQGLFFTEPGSQAVMSWTPARGLRSLASTISGPGPLQRDGDKLWVLERKSFYLGDENLAQVDLRTGAVTRVFASPRAGLVDILSLDGFSWVAATETVTGKVLFVDRQSGALAHEVDVAAGPWGMTQLGGCLVIASDESKQATFVSLWGDQPQVLDQWDLTPAGDRLKKPRRIAVSPETGRVFVRSSYTCPTCAGTQSSVFAAEQADRAIFDKCLANDPRR